MRYSVKRLAGAAGITPRTLHYYDEIGLLPPSIVGDNGYRFYDESAALRLQQIMFYRELGLRLADIKGILDDPHFDAQEALLAHRQTLREQATRLDTLIQTIDATIAHIKGEQKMDAEDLFGGFESQQEKEWTQQAMDQYGYDSALVRESARRWRSYTPADKSRIKAEGEAIYSNLAAQIGEDPTSPAVQTLIAQWHAHLRNYYEPTPEVLAGLGEGYAANPDFAATFSALHPDLPIFLRDAIRHYVMQLPD